MTLDEAYNEAYYYINNYIDKEYANKFGDKALDLYTNLFFEPNLPSRARDLYNIDNFDNYSGLREKFGFETSLYELLKEIEKKEPNCINQYIEILDDIAKENSIYQFKTLKDIKNLLDDYSKDDDEIGSDKYDENKMLVELLCNHLQDFHYSFFSDPEQLLEQVLEYKKSLGE